jgi:SAM-dependent methyltransferase
VLPDSLQDIDQIVIGPEAVQRAGDDQALGNADLLRSEFGPVESVDAVFSSHNIEHLYPFEVPIALKEFLRVLKPDGFVVITCPDLRSICQLVADDKLDDVAYQSPSGPITPLDVLYGHGPSLERGDHYMAHRSGFTQRTITQSLRGAGFSGVATMSRGRPPHFDLWALATKATMSENDIRALAAAHFPI